MHETLIETLTEAVGSYYTGDPSTAGIVVARLSNSVSSYDPKTGAAARRVDLEWYVSVVRYSEPNGGGRSVVCCARSGESLRAALVEVADRWRAKVEGSINAVAGVSKMLQRFGL